MRRRLGQHFLKNPAVARAMARSLDLAEGGAIIEIGPGRGQLTQALLKEAEKSARGARVIAIEKDRALAAEARRRFENDPSVQIVEGDALRGIPKFALNLKGESYKLAGNIPYYITGQLLRLAGELEPRPEACVFMVQKEVAERLAAKPPRMNRLAATVQFWADPKTLFNVSRKEFSPAPDVDSAAILLKKKEGVPAASSEAAVAFYKITRLLFAQPRKTVLNNLKSGLVGMNRGAHGAAEILEQCGVDPGARPQDLDVNSIKKVSKKMA